MFDTRYTELETGWSEHSLDLFPVAGKLRLEGGDGIVEFAKNTFTKKCFVVNEKLPVVELSNLLVNTAFQNSFSVFQHSRLGLIRVILVFRIPCSIYPVFFPIIFPFFVLSSFRDSHICREAHQI